MISIGGKEDADEDDEIEAEEDKSELKFELKIRNQNLNVKATRLDQLRLTKALYTWDQVNVSEWTASRLLVVDRLRDWDCDCDWDQATETD